MKQTTLPTLVIIITAVLALLMFVSIDHSGLSINDCSLEKTNGDNSYNFTYTLLSGRNFNHLQCNYTIYSENNTIIKYGSSDLKNVYMGSFPISEVFSTDNNTLKPYKADITVYTKINTTENNVNKTRMEKSYNKTFIF